MQSQSGINTKKLNELIVEIFNNILQIEEAALKNGPFSDLSITEMHTIEAIGVDQARTMSEVAGILHIAVSTLTAAVNRMVRKSYVERARTEEDRRIVKLRLTRKGQIVFRLHEKFHYDMVRAMMKGLDIKNQELLIDSLTQLKDFLQCDFSKKYNP